MNKVGDFLTCKKEIEIRYSSTPTYTIGKRYQILHINDNGLFYLTNDSDSFNWEYSQHKSEKDIKSSCTLWKTEFIDEYFTNISEERKNKISKIRNLYKL